MTREAFLQRMTVKTNDTHHYISIETEIGRYGQALRKNEYTELEAKKRFLELYYPMYCQDVIEASNK